MKSWEITLDFSKKSWEIALDFAKKPWEIALDWRIALDFFMKFCDITLINLVKLF